MTFRNSVNNTTNVLLHRGPVKSIGQVHLGVPTNSLQVPPFIHGILAQLMYPIKRIVLQNWLYDLVIRCSVYSTLYFATYNTVLYNMPHHTVL